MTRYVQTVRTVDVELRSCARRRRRPRCI